MERGRATNQAAKRSTEIMIGSGGIRRAAAFGVVAFFLITAADIEPTAELAVAFSYLILLSAAMTVGPVAFARLSSLVGGSAESNLTVTTAQRGTGFIS